MRGEKRSRHGRVSFSWFLRVYRFRFLARGLRAEIDTLLIRLLPGSFPSRAIGRSPNPYFDVDIASPIDLRGVKKISGRDRAPPVSLLFPLRRFARLSKSGQFDFTPQSRKRIDSATRRECALATKAQSTVGNPEWKGVAEMAAQPCARTMQQYDARLTTSVRPIPPSNHPRKGNGITPWHREKTSAISPSQTPLPRSQLSDTSDSIAMWGWRGGW